MPARSGHWDGLPLFALRDDHANATVTGLDAVNIHSGSRANSAGHALDRWIIRLLALRPSSPYTWKAMVLAIPALAMPLGLSIGILPN